MINLLMKSPSKLTACFDGLLELVLAWKSQLRFIKPVNKDWNKEVLMFLLPIKGL